MGHLAVLHQLITGNSRGLPMSLFALMALLGTGLGPVTMAWVEANPRLQWRWIHWIQFSMTPSSSQLLYFADAQSSHRRRVPTYRRRRHEGDTSNRRPSSSSR